METPESAQRVVVLVVDDSAETVAMLADALESNGISALVALRGERALAIGKQITPDAIVLDAVMPGMDGFETCRRIRQDPDLAHAPVIFMTGLSDADHVERGFAAGGVDYVTKPIDPRALIARIRAHVAKSRETIGARSALDGAGRFLLSVDPAGRLLWWTPQAGRLVAGFLVGGLKPGAALPPGVRDMVTAPAGVVRAVRLADVDTALEIALVSRSPQGDCLLRVVDAANEPRAAILKSHLPLSEREAEVLDWIAQGKSNRDIADILEMSARTVNKHLERIFRKIGVENRTSAALVALNCLGERQRGPDDPGDTPH